MIQNSNSNSKIKKVLVVGMGSIGKRHIHIIHRLYPNVNIAVLRHEHCNDFGYSGVNRCFTRINDALSYNPDVAIIANPASMHLGIAKQLAKNGIHLLIEKPISINLDGVQDLIELCKKTDVILMTAYNLRFSPTLIEFKKQLRANKVGKLYSVRAEVGQYLPSWRPNLDYRKTVSAQRKLGGGALLELSHEIDYLRWLFGPVEWVSAYMDKKSNLEIDVEDIVHLIIGFQNDSDERSLTASLNMDFIRHDSTRVCVAIGEKGTLRWDGIAGKVEYYPKNTQAWEEVFSFPLDRDYTYTEEIKHFISCVEQENLPSISAKDGMKTLAVIDAARQSNQSMQRVYLA